MVKTKETNKMTGIKKPQKKRMHVCIDCGAQFEGFPQSKYCAECANRRNAESIQRSKAAEKARNKMSKARNKMSYCLACGKIKIVNEECFCKACVNERWDEVYKLRRRPHDTFRVHSNMV